jgi:hypothetical protein
MLTTAEETVLNVFREYQLTPGKMLCFHGKWYEEHEAPLRHLIAKNLLNKEEFRGGYSLTETGFAAVRTGRRSEVRKRRVTNSDRE